MPEVGRGALLVLKEQQRELATLSDLQLQSRFEVCRDVSELLAKLENGVSGQILLGLGQEYLSVLDCLGLLQSLGLPATVHLLTAPEQRLEGWILPPWINLSGCSVERPVTLEELSLEDAESTHGILPLRVGDLLALIEVGGLSLSMRLRLKGRMELEIITSEGGIWSALLGDSMGFQVLVDTLFEPVLSVMSRRHIDLPGERQIAETLEDLLDKRSEQILRRDDKTDGEKDSNRPNKVVPIERGLDVPTEIASACGDGIEASSSGLGSSELLRKTKEGEEMSNISEVLASAMEIDGVKGVALADYESGMCLGSQGGGAGFDLEVAAAGNAEVVRAKHKVMSQLGLTDDIEDILISLGKEYHLIFPITGEKLFLYLAFNRAGANLALARHKAGSLASRLEV